MNHMMPVKQYKKIKMEKKKIKALFNNHPQLE